MEGTLIFNALCMFAGFIVGRYVDGAAGVKMMVAWVAVFVVYSTVSALLDRMGVNQAICTVLRNVSDKLNKSVDKEFGKKKKGTIGFYTE